MKLFRRQRSVPHRSSNTRPAISPSLHASKLAKDMSKRTKLPDPLKLTFSRDRAEPIPLPESLRKDFPRIKFLIAKVNSHYKNYNSDGYVVFFKGATQETTPQSERAHSTLHRTDPQAPRPRHIIDLAYNIDGSI